LKNLKNPSFGKNMQRTEDEEATRVVGFPARRDLGH
jgi:hypothetical protein